MSRKQQRTLNRRAVRLSDPRFRAYIALQSCDLPNLSEITLTFAEDVAVVGPSDIRVDGGIASLVAVGNVVTLTGPLPYSMSSVVNIPGDCRSIRGLGGEFLLGGTTQPGTGGSGSKPDVVAFVGVSRINGTTLRLEWDATIIVADGQTVSIGSTACSSLVNAGGSAYNAIWSAGTPGSGSLEIAAWSLGGFIGTPWSAPVVAAVPP